VEAKPVAYGKGLFMNLNNEGSLSHPIVENFASLEEWRLFAMHNGQLFSKAFSDTLVENILINGFMDPLSKKKISGLEVKHDNDNIRESIKHSGWISRHRAVYFMMNLLLNVDSKKKDIKVYSPEATTDWALNMRKLFPNFIGSEFEPTSEVLATIAPFGHQDLCDMTFPDSIFDLVITQEVLEHIPSVDKALSEICRILLPGGWSINSHPFAVNSYFSVTKAYEENGQLKIIGEPEHHGNPISDLGSLVYEIPGWDILERAKKCGFSEAKIWFIVNPELGIVSEISGILVSCFRK